MECPVETSHLIAFPANLLATKDSDYTRAHHLLNRDHRSMLSKRSVGTLEKRDSRSMYIVISLCHYKSVTSSRGFTILDNVEQTEMV
jgi:hypothetical protein